MIIVRHRRNSREQLDETPAELGVEVDIRSRGEELIVHHDPFVGGERFEDWLTAFRHRLLILNVKEEGLEEKLIWLMAARGIREYFFLDQSFPFLVRTANGGERRCAVRVSEFESVETALALAGRVDWVWVDCFTHFPLDGAQARRLQKVGFRLCVVSPELQGKNAAEEIAAMREELMRESICVDAVCTREPRLWQ